MERYVSDTASGSQRWSTNTIFSTTLSDMTRKDGAFRVIYAKSLGPAEQTMTA
jgi:hypothetical protein